MYMYINQLEQCLQFFNRRHKGHKSVLSHPFDKKIVLNHKYNDWIHKYNVLSQSLSIGLKKSLSLGLETIWSRKKLSVSVSKIFGLKKKSRYWSRKLGIKKVSVLVSKDLVSKKVSVMVSKKSWYFTYFKIESESAIYYS